MFKTRCQFYYRKQLFAYNDASFECVCNAYIDKDVQIEFEFICPNGKKLEELRIFLHYHKDGMPERPYINKVTIDFIKESDRYLCQFRDGVFEQTYDLEYRLDMVEGEYNLRFSVPQKLFERDVVTYSVNFLRGHAWDVCVSGETWIDFKTMRHLKLEAKES